MFITCLSAGRRSLTEPKRLTEGLNSKVAWSAPFIYGYAGHPEKKDYLHQTCVASGWPLLRKTGGFRPRVIG